MLTNYSKTIIPGLIILLMIGCTNGFNTAPVVAAGGRHTCVLTSQGGVKCWGNNYHGELGNNSNVIESAVPVDVSNLTHGVTAITTGGFHNCAVVKTLVECWGANEDG